MWGIFARSRDQNYFHGGMIILKSKDSIPMRYPSLPVAQHDKIFTMYMHINHPVTDDKQPTFSGTTIPLI